MYMMFAFALVFGLAAAVVTAAPASAQTPTPTPTPSIFPYVLVAGDGLAGIDSPGLSMNVKTANETFTVINGLGYPVDPSHVISWAAIEGEGTGEVEIMAGGQPGNNSITVRMVVQGDAIMTCFVDDGQGYTDFLNAEKKWGDITRTVLTATERNGIADTARDGIEPNDFVLVTETVYADFLPGPVEALAGGAKINWWLFENDDEDKAQLALEALLLRFGPGNSSKTSGPLGEGEGCGTYSWWGYLGDDTFIPEDNINYLFDDLGYAADYTAFTQAEGSAIVAQPTRNYVTYTDNVNEPLGNGVTNIGVTFSDTGLGEAEPVIVVVLADYPLDKNGENTVCIEYIKFTPQPITTTCQVKTPQLRWAGEKIVLEKEWPVTPGMSMFYDTGSGKTTITYDLYAAVYSLEGESIGNLEPITKFLGYDLVIPNGMPSGITFTAAELGLPTGADQVIQPLGGVTVVDPMMHPLIVDQESSISRVILVSEQSGQADVNAALYGIRIELVFEMGPHPQLGMLLKTVVTGFGPQMNHGFVVYYMDFEDVESRLRGLLYGL